MNKHQGHDYLIQVQNGFRIRRQVRQGVDPLIQATTFPSGDDLTSFPKTYSTQCCDSSHILSHYA